MSLDRYPKLELEAGQYGKLDLKSVAPLAEKPIA
jgi:hypothetical protein